MEYYNSGHPINYKYHRLAVNQRIYLSLLYLLVYLLLLILLFRVFHKSPVLRYITFSNSLVLFQVYISLHARRPMKSTNFQRTTYILQGITFHLELGRVALFFHQRRQFTESYAAPYQQLRSPIRLSTTQQRYCMVNYPLLRFYAVCW